MVYHNIFSIVFVLILYYFHCMQCWISNKWYILRYFEQITNILYIDFIHRLWNVFTKNKSFNSFTKNPFQFAFVWLVFCRTTLKTGLSDLRRLDLEQSIANSINQKAKSIKAMFNTSFLLYTTLVYLKYLSRHFSYNIKDIVVNFVSICLNNVSRNYVFEQYYALVTSNSQTYKLKQRCISSCSWLKSILSKVSSKPKFVNFYWQRSII